MSTNVTLNGTTYTIPRTGDSAWSATGGVDDYLVAVATGFLSKAGGAFTLTADANFGGTYGLTALYYKTRNAGGTSNIATTGVMRLANAESLAWRNAANGANLELKVNASNVLEFNGAPIVTLALGSADTALRMNAGGTAYEWAKLVNANIDAAAAIAYSKLALTGSIVNADVSGSAAIAYSKLNLATSIVNADVSGSAAIAYSKLNLATSIVNTDVSGSAAIAYSKLNLATSIVNADVAVAAAIARTKIANGTASHVVINDGSGTLSSEASLAISRGGTGQATATAAMGALSPLTTKGDLLTYHTAANQRLGVGTNGQVLTADSAETAGVKWSDSSAGAGELNAVSNPSCASATTGYSAGTSHTVSRVTASSPLDPVITTALQVQATANVSEGATSGGYYSIATMPSGLLSKKLKVECYVTVPSGDTWAVSVRASGTRLSLSTDSSSVTTLVANATYKFTTYFDTSTATAYTVHFTRTGGSGTTNLLVTNLIVGPGIQPQGAVIGEWIDYSPTLGGTTGDGTVSYTTQFGRYRRVGDSVEVEGIIVPNVVTSAPTGDLTIKIPASLTADALGSGTHDAVAGGGFFYDASANTRYPLYVGHYGTTDGEDEITLFGASIAGATLPTLQTTDQVGFHFTLKVQQWAGSGTVNLAQNDVEYAYNTAGTTAAGGSDTTSFGYGPGGAAMGSINATTNTGNSVTEMTVQFQTPIQVTDELILEVDGGSSGARWVPIACQKDIVAYNTHGAASYGMAVRQSAASQAVVTFGNAGRHSSGSGYSDAGSTWAGISTWRWRVKKTTGGQAVGFGLADSAGNAGLVNPYSSSGAGVVYAGTYTPTLTGTSNVAAATVPGASFQYIRVGQFVHVTGNLSIDPTAAAPTATTLTITLPVAPTNNFSNTYDLIGNGVGDSSATAGLQGGQVYATTSAKTATYDYNANDTSNRGHRVTFSYKLV